MIYTKVENNEHDIEQVARLWKSEVRALGPLWHGDIESYLEEDAYYCIKDDDNNIVAMCSFHVMKIRPEVRIEALAVKPEYRGKGYAKELIHRIYRANNNLIDYMHYDFTAEAREGEPNNEFYDKICYTYERHPKKTMVMRYYYFDMKQVHEWKDSWKEE